MKKYLSIFLLIIILLIVVIPNSSYCSDIGLGDLNAYRGNDPGSTELEGIAGKIVSVVQAIGAVVSVVMLIVIGIRYMLGSVEERAEYKETLKPYIIGALLVFAITLVPQLIYQFAQNL